MIKLMQFKSFGLSDIGFYRKKKEDAFALVEECAFFVLADGIGGHPSGDVASTQAVKALCTLLKDQHISFLQEKNSTKEIQKAFSTLIEKTNEHVFSLAQTEDVLLGMGTTLACVYFYEDALLCAHVGDSRIYRMRNRRLEQLTEDHSLVQDLYEQGLISEEEKKKHHKRNVITRAIGTRQEVLPSIRLTDSHSEDLYFLCSDGLTDVLTNLEMEAIINQCQDLNQNSNPDSNQTLNAGLNQTQNTDSNQTLNAGLNYDLEIAANLLVNAAKKKGSRDNITVLFVKKHL